MTYQPAIQDGRLYLNNGREDLDGSIRVAVDPDTSVSIIEKRLDGVWQPSTLELGSNTLWIGKNVGLSGIGKHLAVHAANDHVHFAASSEFDPTTGLTIGDTTTLYSYAYTQDVIFQGDHTNDWSGTFLGWLLTAPVHNIADNVIVRLGSTSTTTPIRYRIWKGTDNTGQLIYDHTYAMTGTETPYVETKYPLIGHLEFEAGNTYWFEAVSTATFSLMTNAAGTIPYIAADISSVRLDNLLQTAPWVDGNTWTAGDYFIDSRKVYVCTVTGVQTGTFASNASKWNNIANESEDLWTRTAGVLQNQTGSTSFVFDDGSAALPRLAITPTQATIYCPDIGAHILVNNAGIFHTVGATSVSYTDAGYTYHDGTRIRIDATSVFTKMVSPDGTKQVAVNNAEIEVTGNIGFENADSRIYSSDNIGYLEFAELGEINWHKTGDAYDRWQINDTGYYMFAPAGTNSIQMTDAAILLKDGTRDRVSVNSTASYVISPDGDQSITVQNGSIALVGLSFDVNDRYRSRFNVGSDSVVINSPNATKSITVDNSQILLTADTKNRLLIDSSSSKLISPDGNKHVAVSNSLIDNQTYWFNIGDFTRTRFRTNTTDVSMYSPNGVSTLAVSNAGTVITGGTEVCSGYQNKSLIIHPYAATYAGGSMSLMGTSDGASGTYENWNMDNFWGLMRIYSYGNKTKTIRIENVSDIATSPNKKLIVEVNGSLKVQGDAGFNATNETATLNMGDANHYLQAKYGTGLIMGSSNGLTIKRGTQDRLRVNATETELLSPTDIYSLIVRDTYMYLFDGYKIRFKMDNTNTTIMSADGDQTFDVNNNSCATNEDLVVGLDLTVNRDAEIKEDLDVLKQVNVGVSGASAGGNETFLTLSRWAEDDLGTALRFQGPNISTGGYYSDWTMQAWMGHLRCGLTSSTGRSMIISNDGTGSVELQVWGGILVTGNDHFDGGGDTAEIWVGDTSNSIIATYQDHLNIKGYNGVSISDRNTADYFLATLGNIRMNNLPTYDPQIAGVLWLDNTYIRVSNPS